MKMAKKATLGLYFQCQTSVVNKWKPLEKSQQQQTDLQTFIACSISSSRDLHGERKLPLGTRKHPSFPTQ